MPSLQRPEVRVVIRILGTLQEKGDRLRPTQLQQAARTNYTQMARYLAFLELRGLVRVELDGQGDRWVVLTSKGYDAHRFLVSALHSLFVEGRS